ncbi:RloB domain-containing protein [Fructobacillus sp. M2-14]|uniref:RloB domain-containing protein n=1 Tax=Fructobacillus broussonetiae TaxID=2713173 RepID=A0ABS5R1B1_9LACO|nr:RloB family protein [Fructobacillus broussonetiae]MBS9339007.1 RloB domain-containing protein [Fructobacillus broussonetiae]
MARLGKKKNRVTEKILIFVEGSETEPNYLKVLKKKLRWHNVDVHSLQSLGRGKDWVQKAKRLLNSQRLAQVQQEAVYVLFDHDGMKRDQYEMLLASAQKESFKVVFSNVSFEIWLLAHYQEIFKTQYDNDMVKQKLSEYIKGSYSKADAILMAQLAQKHELALKNTQKVRTSSYEYNCTNVGDMIEEITVHRKRA